MIIEAVAELRDRFIRLTGGQNMELVDAGVHYNTLYTFKRGGYVSVPILQKIEAWCDAQEGK